MKISLLNILLFCFITITCSVKLSKENVVIAIDCGANQKHMTSAGFEFISDEYYSGQSRIADYTYSEIVQQNKLKYTLEPASFLTERHGEHFGYDIPLSVNGKYTLVLQFVELYFTSPKERVFNILLGDQVVRQDFSIIGNVPERGFAHEEFIEFTFEDEQIFWNGQVCQNAYKYKNKRLVLEFTQGKSDLPKVDGIILLKGGIENIKKESHKAEREQLIEKWDEIEKEIDQPRKEPSAQQQPPQQHGKVFEPVELEIEVIIQLMGKFIRKVPAYCLLVWGMLGLFIFCLMFSEKDNKYKQSQKVTKKSTQKSRKVEQIS